MIVGDLFEAVAQQAHSQATGGVFGGLVPPLTGVKQYITQATQALEQIFSAAGLPLKYAALRADGTMTSSISYSNGVITLTYDAPRPQVAVLNLMTVDVHQVTISATQVSVQLGSLPAITVQVQS